MRGCKPIIRLKYSDDSFRRRWRLDGTASRARTAAGITARGNTGVARAVCLALLCVLLPGPSLAGAAQNEPIVFFGDRNLPPYEYLEGGEPRGVSVDLLNAIGEALERPVEVRLMKWSEAQKRALNGDAHALTLMSKNEQRLKLYDFSDGTFNFTFSLFVGADHGVALDASGLDGKRIAVTKGGFPRTFLEEHQPEAELIIVDTVLEGFNRLLLGEIDAVGSETRVGYYFLHENDISSIRALPRPFAVKIGGIPVPKGDEALVREINRALAEIKRSGRFARIMGAWSQHEVVLLERKEIWTFVAIAALASIALASLVLLLWVVQSRKSARNRAAEVQAANTLLQEEIAERIQVEEALRESEERLSLAVESANFGTWIRTVPDDRVILDARTEAIFGLEPGTFEGTLDAYLARVHPDDHERIKAGHARLLKDGVRYEIDYRAILPDGSIRHVATRASLIRNARDSTVQIIGMLHDITERKRVEEALRESEERFRTMLEQAGDAMFLIEPDGSFIDVNQRACDALGYTRAELLTLSVPEIDPVFSKEKFHDLFEGLQLGAPVTVEAVHRRKDGTTYPVEIRTGLIALHGRKSLLSFARDISQRKRAEDALREAQEALLRRERLATLGQLTATVSHELRNPLGVIRTSAFILRDGLKEEMPRARRALERIERSVVRCDRIIDEMLDFTRISDLEPEPTALDDWLAGVIEEQPLPTGIVLRQELQLPDLTVAVDRDRLRRAVINVFDNACQAMLGAGESKTEPAERLLTVRTRQCDGRIEVMFEDQGPGIAPDVYERIFEPLYSTKGFGVGLGLPVVKQIMEQHGGGIEIETEEGRGTTVCLWLDRNARAEHVAA